MILSIHDPIDTPYQFIPSTHSQDTSHPPSLSTLFLIFSTPQARRLTSSPCTTTTSPLPYPLLPHPSHSLLPPLHSLTTPLSPHPSHTVSPPINPTGKTSHLKPLYNNDLATPIPPTPTPLTTPITTPPPTSSSPPHHPPFMLPIIKRRQDVSPQALVQQRSRHAHTSRRRGR